MTDKIIYSSDFQAYIQKLYTDMRRKNVTAQYYRKYLIASKSMLWGHKRMSKATFYRKTLKGTFNMNELFILSESFDIVRYV
jgi:methyltransferase-like protein